MLNKTEALTNDRIITWTCGEGGLEREKEEGLKVRGLGSGE